MELLKDAFHFIFQLVNTEYLGTLVDQLGPWLYVLLFAIIFCETGLVVTPFLPGDSLLFAVGAVAANTSLSLPVILILLIAAAVLGDAVNYTAGYRIGPKVFRYESSRLLNKKHLMRAHAFYEKYGGKTIVLALHPDHPYVCALRGRYRRDGLPSFRHLQHSRRRGLGRGLPAGRLLPGEHGDSEAKLPPGHCGHCPHIRAAGGD